MENKPFVIVRSSDSGCHAGHLDWAESNTITLTDSIRLWYWSGAATLSQLAMEGVKNPNECKFAMPVNRITVYGCCEKIECTAAAETSIKSVKPWKQ